MDEPIMPKHLADSPEFVAMWSDWNKYRTEIRKPLKPMAISRQFKFLGAYGPREAAKILDQSIRCQWQGLFPLKGQAARPAFTGPQDFSRPMSNEQIADCDRRLRREMAQGR